MNNAIIAQIMDYAVNKARQTRQARARRSYNQTVRDLIFGKLGEYLAASKYNVSTIDLEIKGYAYSDGGVDLVLRDGKTVSVKTINSKHRYLLLESEYASMFKVDYFVVVKIPHNRRDQFDFEQLFEQSEVSRLIPTAEIKNKMSYHEKGNSELGMFLERNNYAYKLENEVFTKCS